MSKSTTVGIVDDELHPIPLFCPDCGHNKQCPVGGWPQLWSELGCQWECGACGSRKRFEPR